MRKKKNIFKHAVIADFPYQTISPAKSFVPDWYKDTDRFANGIKEIKRQPAPLTFKMCPVFGESFFTGYTIPLTVDLAVEQNNGTTNISWGAKPFANIQYPEIGQPISIRSEEGNEKLPVPMGCSSTHFIWHTRHIYKIPKGYSALYTHPLNRYDLPFYTLSAIIDGEMTVPAGSIPVFFSSTFEGIIPAGTPIAQIILFKTENWESEYDASLLKEADVNNIRSLSKAYGYYKKTFWKKKTYS